MPSFFEVTDLSPLLQEGADCNYCHTDLLRNEKVVVCDDCGSPHHMDCWQANGDKCATFGCVGSTQGRVSRPATTGTVNPARPQNEEPDLAAALGWIWREISTADVRARRRRVVGLAAFIGMIFYASFFNTGAPRVSNVSFSPMPTASPTPTTMSESAVAIGSAATATAKRAATATAVTAANSPLVPAQNAPLYFEGCSQVVGIDEGDCLVLVMLYENLDGPNWRTNTGWLESNRPCDEWHGIRCEAGRVTQIRLSGNQLSGEIPHMVGKLSSLNMLAMSKNQIEGQIPSTLSQLSNLRAFFLSDNQLEGEILTGLGSLPNLERMSLSKNLLSGEIPPQLGSIKRLDLSNNQLSGSIACAVAGSGWFNIKYNQLSAANEKAQECLNNRSKNWASTQTIAPTDVEATLVSTNTIRLTWTPILYTDDGGYYEVGRSDDGGETFTHVGRSSSKEDAEFVVLDSTESDNGAEYLYAVRTFTPSHSDQKNALTSAYSEAVSVQPPSE